MSYARHSRRGYKRRSQKGKVHWVRSTTARHRVGNSGNLSELVAAAGTGASGLALGLSTVAVVVLATAAYATAMLIRSSRQGAKTRPPAGASSRAGIGRRLWKRWREARELAAEIGAARSCERCGMGAATVLNGEPVCASCRKAVLALSGTVVDSRQWRSLRRARRAADERVLRTKARERRAQSEAAAKAERARRREDQVRERAVFEAEAKAAEARLRAELKATLRRQTKPAA